MDDGQNIVEIMSHAAGQLADGLHLLRLPQLLFEPPLLRDVAEEPEQQQGWPRNSTNELVSSSVTTLPLCSVSRRSTCFSMIRSRKRWR